METAKGHYYGTEIDGKWWKRYTRDKLFARGMGEYWYDDRAFYFRRYLTRTPLVFPFLNIIDLATGHWHAGRWAGRRLLIKLIWEKDGIKLSSGFLCSRGRRATETLLRELRERIIVNGNRD